MKTQLGITALAGGAQAGATLIDVEADFITITTVATALDSVILPPIGNTEYHLKEHIIRNTHATERVRLYPPDGSALTLSNGAMDDDEPYILQPNQQISFAQINSSWVAIREPAPSAIRLDADDYEVKAYQNGTMFSLVSANGAGGDCTITLPAPTIVGLRYRFAMVEDNAGHPYIITSTGANMVTKRTTLLTQTADGAGAIGVNSAISVNAGAMSTSIRFTATALRGDWIEIVSDGTNWFASSLSGISTGITVA